MIMATTIQIDNKLKDELFKIKLQLSELEGRNVSYNEVIQRLLLESGFQVKNKTYDRSTLRKFEGSIPKNARKQWIREKYRDFTS